MAIGKIYIETKNIDHCGMCCFFTLMAVWFFYKPVRVFFPELAGVICAQENICIEDLDKLEVAQTLYMSSLNDVQVTVSSFKAPPKFIFCETQSCFEGFGFHKASAQSVGTVATVVGPKGWKKHIVRHEMIHHIQNEQLGSIKFMSMPAWFNEGMAYSLSQDPRETLSEPWESYRKAFNEWYEKIDPDHLWEEAEKL